MVIVIAMLQLFQRAILALIAAFILVGNPPAGVAKQQLFEGYKKVIVLDPGHGGDVDIGARGPEGTLEKAVTLNLARILAAELQENYRVVLTRTDDYEVSLENRTATANNLNADLFVSIHTGGSMVHSTSGIFAYYYQIFSEEVRRQPEGASNTAEDSNAPILWDQVQNRYMEKSRILAGLVSARLKGLEAVQESQVTGAPLAVLQGANMPAILIEIGYLTNPAEEKNLRDQRFLTDLALAVKRGIDDYFEQEH